jgi:hypothetical protein
MHLKSSVFWDIIPCSRWKSIIYQTTRRYIQADITLHNHRRENLRPFMNAVLGKWGIAEELRLATFTVVQASGRICYFLCYC